MKLYAATDLHSSNNYLAIIDENGERRFKQKLPNNPALILEALMPYKKEIAGIVVESTYNWYWLVDMLMAEGYKVHLTLFPIRLLKNSLSGHCESVVKGRGFVFGRINPKIYDYSLDNIALQD
ncbi:MAG: hypothetical protein HY026_02705 [Deltaproteobacteria bacterium]|nr:hypothetical protein [Deltaproteobacteria bacterium]